MEPAPYIPDRRYLVWLDFEPSKGKEIGKYRPALVLSNREYNRKTGLLICCPVSTSIRVTYFLLLLIERINSS